jgi:tetrahydromethanopterin S-methyltransferase subunit G
MYNVRESWTDARLDDFAKHVDQRFDAVDQRFDKVEKRLDRIEDRLDTGFARFDARFDDIQRALAYGAIVLTGGILAGFSAILVLIATQL